MSRFKKLSHTVWECKYHVVWIPKYRFRVMEGRVRYYVRDVVRQLCAWRRFGIVAGNVQRDHIHLVLEIPPNVSISTAIGFLKGKSAVRIFDKFRMLRRKYYGMHFWAKGYAVSTVGLDEQQIRRYVQYQQKRDREVEQQNLFAT